MRIVIFGLSVSSSWGNGHATLWRGLIRALAARKHSVVFFERDMPYYAAHRDLHEIPGGELRLYSEWQDISTSAKRALSEADVGIVTSYCPDAAAATELVLASRVGARVFYDLDTPITLERLRRGDSVEYLPPEGLGGFDLVLSYTGGTALRELRERLGARKAVPLYGSVDPVVHREVRPSDRYRSDFSYIGTYSEDRQRKLEELFLKPALLRPKRKFLIAGSQYPQDFPWRENIHYLRHLPPAEHPDFYSSSRMTLNITRAPMADLGFCPSGRIFEAAACGVPVLTDTWEGLDHFFRPGEEILTASTIEEALAALDLPDEHLRRIAKAARERAIEDHSAARRARELELLLEDTRSERSEGALWGVIPAAGAGTRIQPLAFSKELLPVGSRSEGGVERPRATSEYLVERMIQGGASRICFVISPGKSDILSYFGGEYGRAHLCYTIQPNPAGLCDAIFRAAPLIRDGDSVCVGLPDTIWFPKDGFRRLPTGTLSFLLFQVEHPKFFDAVVLDEEDRVVEIEVKRVDARSNWIWGAFRMPGRIFHRLHALWRQPGRGEEYFGTLVNAYLAEGGEARGVRAGELYVDVGTLHGYREAQRILACRSEVEQGWIPEKSA